MQKIIDVKNAKIIFDCNEIINLFLHTLNIYGILGNHGTQYALRQNEKVINSMDKKIEADVKQGDYYFSYGDLAIFEPGMNYIVNNGTWEKHVDQDTINMGVTQMNFNLAFQKSWYEFYKEYWYDTLTDRNKLFQECINAFDFVEGTKKMTLAAHREFPKNFYVFPAEALTYSGLKFNDNICMGDLQIGEDIGFVHEGLHLLLNEEWAKSTEIIETIKSANYKEEYYHSWAAKYEQALVIGLDCCIRNNDDRIAENYFNGCNVGDVFSIAYPLIKDYYYNGCNESIEKLMLNIISHTL